MAIDNGIAAAILFQYICDGLYDMLVRKHRAQPLKYLVCIRALNSWKLDFEAR